jgi:hypothetical protein
VDPVRHGSNERLDEDGCGDPRCALNLPELRNNLLRPMRLLPPAPSPLRCRRTTLPVDQFLEAGPEAEAPEALSRARGVPFRPPPAARGR